MTSKISRNRQTGKALIRSKLDPAGLYIHIYIYHKAKPKEAKLHLLDDELHDSVVNTQDLIDLSSPPLTPQMLLVSLSCCAVGVLRTPRRAFGTGLAPGFLGAARRFCAGHIRLLSE